MSDRNELLPEALFGRWTERYNALTALVKRQAEENDRLAKRMGCLDDLNRGLADRLAAASEALGDLAERFERAAYLEGWKAGFLSSVYRLIGIPPEEMAKGNWEQSDSAKRLERRKTK